ncbi:hypothetical protein BAQ46_00755 [Bacillus paranthracis]|uniref:hypothetical protein n=1 Tax=Bacillus paranthracis TaxID=2026186 RepID=UPI0008FE0703|nr:hypothetical protein [Bacillus paranthracis]OJE20330.1 hypothetical protein BAQ46_00755 [Bacillus paranthracis]
MSYKFRIGFEVASGVRVNVDPKANILTLNKVKDALEILPEYRISTIYPAPTRPGGTEVGVGTYKIDFEKMSKTYDAINVSREVARADIRHTERYSPFAGWGISSTLWFNTDHLELESELSTKELKELLMNA